MARIQPTVSRRAVLKATAAGGSLGTIASVTAGKDDASEIDSCTTITEPGVYVLSDDLFAEAFDCIEIRSDDVVVDGSGYTLELEEETRERFRKMAIPSRGNRMYGTGVGTIEPVRNVTVRNLIVSTWDTGVRLAAVTSGSIDDVTASGNADGLALEDAADSTVSGSTAIRNHEDGIVVRSSTGCSLAENVAGRNARAGIALVDSTANTVHDVAVGHNKGDGIVLEGADRNELSEIASSDDTVGIALVDARENYLSAVEADRCGFAGIALGDASENELTGLTVSNVVGDEPIEEEPSAIWLFASSKNHFEDVRSGNNDVWTVYATNESVGNQFDDVTIDDGGAFSTDITDEAIDHEGNVWRAPAGGDDSTHVSVSIR